MCGAFRVVKTFGQSVFSFRKFKKAIDNYSEWTIAYTRSMRNPMLGFTTAINAAFTMIIAFGVFMSRKGTTPGAVIKPDLLHHYHAGYHHDVK